MTKFLNYVLEKGIYLIALLATVLTIDNICNYDKKNNDVVQDSDIQSFIIRTLDNSLYLQSSNEQYCRFLELYSDSFSVTSEVSEEQLIVDEYTALLEFTNVGGENYSVYIQLSEPLDNVNKNKFVELLQIVSPTVMAVDSISMENTFIFKNSISKEFQKFFNEIKVSLEGNPA